MNFKDCFLAEFFKIKLKLDLFNKISSKIKLITKDKVAVIELVSNYQKLSQSNLAVLDFKKFQVKFLIIEFLKNLQVQ
jgi:hypothetical protein